VTTTEFLGYQEAQARFDGGGAPLGIRLPARSLTTLVRE
jgi:hypothetical protein